MGYLAALLLWAVIAAGVLTALLVLALHPPTGVWIAVWVLLTVAGALLWLRADARPWFDWLRGRR